MVYTMREVGPRGPRGGGVSPPGPFTTASGPWSRPEKVKYPAMGEASIVKRMYNYSFKLYIGPYTMARHLFTYVYKFIYYAE